MAKIAFLGSGRMAAAIVDGLLARAVCAPGDLFCADGGDGTAAALAARAGVVACADPARSFQGADLVVLAFKPQQLAELDAAVAGATSGKPILSILAGKRIARLEEAFPQARNIVRAMPNTPGQIGAGITGWCAREPLAAADRALVEAVLAALGVAVEVTEPQLDAVTGLSGSGPAYVFEFAAALREAGEAAGLPRAIAWKFASETVLGAARLMARSQTEPETLRDQVTSPNGTTYAGLQRMAARDFRGLIRETVLAATARSEELSRD